MGGEASTVVTLTGNGPVSYTLTGLQSGTATKTVTVLSSATACGTASVTYAAPASCTTVALASLGDKVFTDVNGNGIQDVGDTPIPGVIVTLIQTGTVVATTTTLSSGTGVGCYSFTGLTPGVPYSVSFTTPAGFTASPPLSGTDTTKDSNPVNGITAPITLTAGENNPTIDAGFIPLRGSLGDFVWKEVVQDGKYDPGTELGVANITVKLLEVTSPVGAPVVSTSLVSTTVTNGAGKYLFSNLPAGRYVVEFVKTSLPANCLTSPDFQKPGVPNALNSDADPYTGLSPIITIVPTDPTKKDILTVDAALIVPGCKPICVPITVKRVR